MRIKALHTVIVKNRPIYPGEEATIATDMGQALIAREYATAGTVKKKGGEGDDKPKL